MSRLPSVTSRLCSACNSCRSSVTFRWASWSFKASRTSFSDKSLTAPPKLSCSWFNPSMIDSIFCCFGTGFMMTSVLGLLLPLRGAVGVSGFCISCVSNSFFSFINSSKAVRISALVLFSVGRLVAIISYRC